MYAELIRKKKCSGCKEKKTLENFTKNRAAWDGVSNYCRPCRAQVKKLDYENNKERIKEQVKASYQRHKARAIRYAQKYRKENPEKIKHTKLMQDRGISLDKYNQMLEAQNNVCAICNRPELKLWKGKIPNLCVDHCHTTNEIRGLLCMKCNRGIGLLEDNIESLLSAISYLKKYQK